MNISSAAAMVSSAGYLLDKGTNGETTTKTPDKRMNNVTSIDALHKAELQGDRVAPGDEQMVKKLDRILKAIQGPNTSFEMSMHKQTKTVVIKVFNKDTGELIREIPPEKTLDLVAKFMEINGILIDEKV